MRNLLALLIFLILSESPQLFAQFDLSAKKVYETKFDKPIPGNIPPWEALKLAAEQLNKQLKTDIGHFYLDYTLFSKQTHNYKHKSLDDFEIISLENQLISYCSKVSLWERVSHRVSYP